MEILFRNRIIQPESKQIEKKDKKNCENGMIEKSGLEYFSIN